jgi:heptosyltransferase-2
LKILVLRGGGIGDFLLTLPAIGLLREGFPDCHLEVMSYRRVLALVDRRYYADAVCEMDSGPMASCFHPDSQMPEALAAYFRSFGRVVSYLFDPDGLFAGSLARVGVGNLLAISPKVGGTDHAASQLARPLERLALFLQTPWAPLQPSPEDHAAAAKILAESDEGWIAVHPGSGGEAKIWPLSSWISLLRLLRRAGRRVVVLGGEADHEKLSTLRAEFGRDLVFLENLPLEVLAACLRRAGTFVGHDSGISHLAAAAGAPCILLFGPTDPKVWAPARPGVRVLSSPTGALAAIRVETVGSALGL